MFEPIVCTKANTLIVGTWPSPKSRAQGFYYGHPQNRFWPMLAAVLGEPVPTSIAQKKALLYQNNLALWDVIESCTINGASDASIRDVVPNPIAEFCEKYRIETVLCNGATAYQLCVKYVTLPDAITVLKMPSTSPANAAWSLEKLKQVWGETIKNARA